MTDRVNSAAPVASVPEPNPADEVFLQVAQLEAENKVLHHELKTLRQLLERAIVHRQSSHHELVLLLTNLVNKLPMNDVGGLVARLVEHGTNVNQYLAALLKGTVEAHIEQPSLLKSYENAKRDLSAATQPLVDELLRLDTPLERDLLEALPKDPEQFFSPRTVRATRCFLKAQVPRERIIRQFGPEGLVFFNDLTTDPKLNPRPKQEEIVLGFKPEFESVLEQHPAFADAKRRELIELYQRVQKSKGNTEQSRLQKNLFQQLSFIIELLHFYEHQNTESPEVIFAHRLPALVEQLVLPSANDELDERLIAQAEGLMSHVLNPDNRLMIINNTGKAGDTGKTLKLVLKLRTDKLPDADGVVQEFVKHLVQPPPNKPPESKALARILKLIPTEMQRRVIRTILHSGRMRKDEAGALAKALAPQLGLDPKDLVAPQEVLTPEVERQLAWAKVKDLIARRSDPASIAAAIRERLSAKYDADEIRQSWITLTEADPMALIRVFCHLPYGANGKTEAIARPVMETYVSRLTHEKYASTYNRVVKSLRNMFHAKPDSPTLLNFTALVRWVSPEAADKLCAEIGMAVHA